METSGPYTLEETEGDRPLVISDAQGGQVFSFEQRDKRHAEEILENLNIGRAWVDPELELETALVTESLDDSDALVEVA